MIDVVHRVCGRVAFRYDHFPHPNEIHDPDHAVLLDGSRPTWGDRIVCGSCGQDVDVKDLRPVK